MRVIVHTEPHAEDNAALQAWYSRSNKSVEEHREKLSREGSGRFMDQIFIQYGHASVGDLGTVTVYFENVSMLAAKAIQDNPLYNGQECSSRYIDFGGAAFLTAPHPPDVVTGLLSRMREFYVSSLPFVEKEVARANPQQIQQSDTAYKKAVKARAFDILRGFLPCGAATSLAWSGTLRNFKERLELLMHHPLDEVFSLAAIAYNLLHDKYPNSFEAGYATVAAELEAEGLQAARTKVRKSIENEEKWECLSDVRNFYSDILVAASPFDNMEIAPAEKPDLSGLPHIHRDYAQAMSRYTSGTRPTRHGGSELYRVEVDAQVDFGSFRDLQRHRGGYCSMPVVDASIGFHSWYFQTLPEQLIPPAVCLLDDIAAWDAAAIETAPTEAVRIDNQYFMPMGCIVPVQLSYSLRQATYVADLRSSQTVHPTLRPLAQSMGEYIRGKGFAVRFDDRPDAWSVRRGEQDIIERATQE